MTATAASFIDALPLPVMVIGPDARIVLVNLPARSLVTTGVVGRNYVTALRQPQLLDAIEQTGTDRRARSTTFQASEGGRDTTWRVSLAPVTLASGPGIVLSFEDITAVEAAGQMRRDFVANVSHELRTPLTALLGFIETLKGAARDDPVARMRFLTMMEAEAERMSQLVQDLLSLSRVEEDERVRPLTPVILSALAGSVVDAFADRAAAVGMVLNLTLPAAPVVIPGDADQLRQVLNNLIENAIKYGGAHQPVDIALSEPSPEPGLRADGIRLTVTDRGEGIEPHHIPRLTERFYRIDNHRSREVGGTGLGLAIVKHIVSRHRGRFKIESEVGQGSRFTIILPMG